MKARNEREKRAPHTGRPLKRRMKKLTSEERNTFEADVLDRAAEAFASAAAEAVRMSRAVRDGSLDTSMRREREIALSTEISGAAYMIDRLRENWTIDQLFRMDQHIRNRRY